MIVPKGMWKENIRDTFADSQPLVYYVQFWKGLGVQLNLLILHSFLRRKNLFQVKTYNSKFSQITDGALRFSFSLKNRLLIAQVFFNSSICCKLQYIFAERNLLTFILKFFCLQKASTEKSGFMQAKPHLLTTNFKRNNYPLVPQYDSAFNKI